MQTQGIKFVLGLRAGVTVSIWNFTNLTRWIDFYTELSENPFLETAWRVRALCRNTWLVCRKNRLPITAYHWLSLTTQINEPHDAVSQTLSEASEEKSKEIKEKLLVPVFALFQWRNTLQFWHNWYKWCFSSSSGVWSILLICFLPTKFEKMQQHSAAVISAFRLETKGQSS